MVESRIGTNNSEPHSPRNRARARQRTRLEIIAALCILALGGCTPRTPGIEAPSDSLHFPIGVAADPGGRYLFVVSSNFDRLHTSGTINVVDLLQHRIVPESTIRIGSFGGRMVLQTETTAEGEERAIRGYVTVRGDNSLTWFDIEWGEGAPRLRCSDNPDPEKVHQCEERYVVKTKDEPLVNPFGLLLLEEFPGATFEGDQVLVGSLLGNHLLSFWIDSDGTPHQSGMQAMEPGVHGIAASPRTHRVYIANKFHSFLRTYSVEGNGYLETEEGRQIPQVRFEDRGIIRVGGVSRVQDFGRDMVFTDDGTLAFVAYRNPDSIVVLDVSTQSADTPRNQIVAAIDVGRDPARLVLVQNELEPRLYLYVLCFRADQVYVLDTELLEVVDVIEVGRGPYDAAVVDNPKLGIKRMYISSFEDHAISVLELKEDDPFYHTVLAHIW